MPNTQSVLTEIPYIPRIMDEYKRSKIKIYPCYVNRASSLGDICERRLVYQRTNWRDAIPHEVDLQYIFDEGNFQEEVFIREMNQAGIQTVESQRPYEWKEHQISGHIDGKIAYKGNLYPFDIKSMSPNVFDKVDELNPESLQRYSWTKKYIPQLLIYLLLSNEQNGMLIFKNKSTGKPKQMNVCLNENLDIVEFLIQKADRINFHVENNTLPDRIIDASECQKCAFRHICIPDIKNEGIEIIDDFELESKLDEYFKLKEAAKRYSELEEEIKSKTKNRRLNIGNYLIEGKEIIINHRSQPSKEAYTSTYWKQSIIKI